MTAPSDAAEVPVSALRARSNQPRRFFSEAALAALAASLTENGVLQPLLVRPQPGGQYEVIAGERRLRAAKLAGLSRVPVRVHPCTDAEADQLSLIENLQREDLSRFEDVSFKLRLIAASWEQSPQEAKATLRKLKKHPQEDAERVAELEGLFQRLGREQWTSFVANGLPVLDLPDLLLQALQEGVIQQSKAVLIARAPADQQQALLERAVNEQLSVEQLRASIAQLTVPAPLSGVEQRFQALRKLQPRAFSKLSPEQQQQAQHLLDQLQALLN
ncbi:ParB/RepB/Spo0J family partition protein [Deinococcus ruber]|uniref:ParB/RepB/Spo0J family partition protein n=1 Tax=Deinococcus ruber TaxID=1848197 RepID=UPI001664D5D4|nr:ParB/RepB/Spo0J family partition protein [Deinococcus ruber]